MRGELTPDEEKRRFNTASTTIPDPQYGDQVVCILSELLPNRSVGEFRRLVASLETKRVEAYDMCSGRPAPQAKAATATTIYTADKIHVFGVIPVVISLNAETPVTIRGNGYECAPLPIVEFRWEADPDNVTKTYNAVSIWCDADLNEYLHVPNVKLDHSGNWRVYVRNQSSTDWSEDCAAANFVYVP